MDEGYSLQALADYTGSRLQGNAALRLYAVVSIEKAQAGELSYVRNAKYRHFLETSQASALILPPDLAETYRGDCLVSQNPYLAYAKAVTLLHSSPPPNAGIHPSAVIAEDAEVADLCSIGAHVVIESGTRIASGVIIEAGCVIGRDCRIGENSRLYPNVTLYPGTEIGKRCIIHAGAVLGADGFGFAPDGKSWFKIPQVGNVVVGNDVEIGSNTCIDRAAMGSTIIGDGVKLDNLLQIAHNVQIGEHTAMAACTAVAGSVRIGRYCQIGGMSAIAGHLDITDNVVVTGTSLVSHSLTKPGVYSSGTTVVDNAVWRKNAVRFNQLDKLARRLQELERQLAVLQDKGSN
ncbi:MAG: UDP-3-O-(3-hydroxymyristoyl)glucosamine N-acyltransferase [Candidatus Thiothrix singaporensis]|uniref:UDP-3-O-acylglucosamine N-acyltransferase n=1 Tax=Candidatus Thiothrix singaporensis TaxID=2799669 RepID=A0A7L6AQ12_9GAMM|nr:MAG: UDP-3-O-(3-hydroxymyristoyl)glucosamine N-acyltransferase [Candidatus Thiothrix singaporensis]